MSYFSFKADKSILCGYYSNGNLYQCKKIDANGKLISDTKSSWQIDSLDSLVRQDFFPVRLTAYLTRNDSIVLSNIIHLSIDESNGYIDRRTFDKFNISMLQHLQNMFAQLAFFTGRQIDVLNQNEVYIGYDCSLDISEYIESFIKRALRA